MTGTLERQRDVYKEVVDMDWKEVVRCAPEGAIRKALKFCESHECVDCPIHINNIEHRTEHDKCCEFVPCVDNLIYELVVHPHYSL